MSTYLNPNVIQNGSIDETKLTLELQTKINSAEETYTAGTNIDITGNVISTTGVATTSQLETHINDDNIHVTSGEKSRWDAKYTKPSSGISTADLASGIQENLSYISTIKSAFTLNDLNTLRTDASKGASAYANLGGHTVGVNVPANAIFTDTIYDDTNVLSAISSKQDILIGTQTAGQNIKTINGESILGTGNITISGGSGAGTSYTAGTNIDITNGVISVTGITVPTKTSDLTNDSGFLTEHQSLSAYSTTSQMNTAISAATNNMATQTWVNGQGFLKSYTEQYTGTVTSVGVSVPTGLSVSGSPVTTSGTVAISYASGYSIPTTAKQTQWDGAVTNSHTHSNSTVLDGITSANITSWNNKQDVISDLATIRYNSSNVPFITRQVTASSNYILNGTGQHTYEYMIITTASGINTINVRLASDAATNSVAGWQHYLLIYNNNGGTLNIVIGSGMAATKSLYTIGHAQQIELAWMVHYETNKYNYVITGSDAMTWLS